MSQPVISAGAAPPTAAAAGDARKLPEVVALGPAAACYTEPALG